ncbi:MAG TPA: DUF3987 domain-containing protein [Methylophaga aminisulfidivorans]|uniref:DUF3987 domain-containing protein n=2 Tax=root TaxID=1 RepID=A0A7C1W5V9_9GAMM|nr:DUF3987 domain-containing protein [Methylophaga sp.]HEC74556.1 DUF3987 domain-containing protein [Methylophaga aminisulfidivorans]
MNKPLLNVITKPIYGWVPLEHLEQFNLPKLTSTILPDWAGEYAEALSASTETPLELAAAMVLAACSTAAARNLTVQVKADYSEPCNLWLVAALPSGSRKSAVQAAATKPLLFWEMEKENELTPAIVRINRERDFLLDRIKQKQRKAAKEDDVIVASTLMQEIYEAEALLPKVPALPRLWTSDITPEKLGSLLAEQNERMAWLSSEGGIFDLLGGRYSNGIPNLDLILKSHSGDSERVDRGSRETVRLNNPLVTIGLSPQPSVLRGLATKPGFRGRGLIARFLFLQPESNLGTRTLDAMPVPQNIADNYTSGIKSMLNWVENTEDDIKHTLNLSEDAYQEWMDFSLYIETEMQPNGLFAGMTDWAGKAPGAVIRIAGVFHAIQYAFEKPWEYDISADTMYKALELMAVITGHSVTVITAMGVNKSSSKSEHVWKWIKRNKKTEFTIRDAFNGLSSTYNNVAELKPILEDLVERGYIRIEERVKVGPGQKPSPMVKVRPELSEDWL